MKIIGIQGMSAGELNSELARGGKFVFYQYCISVLLMTFKQSSSIYFVRQGESTFLKAGGFCAISLLLGWWGIPWGPIWTVQTVVTNLRGGKNVTQEVIASFNESARAAEQTVKPAA